MMAIMAMRTDPDYGGNRHEQPSCGGKLTASAKDRTSTASTMLGTPSRNAHTVHPS
jgi:hypothetical protein